MDSRWTLLRGSTHTSGRSTFPSQPSKLQPHVAYMPSYGRTEEKLATRGFGAHIWWSWWCWCDESPKNQKNQCTFALLLLWEAAVTCDGRTCIAAERITADRQLLICLLRFAMSKPMGVKFPGGGKSNQNLWVNQSTRPSPTKTVLVGRFSVFPGFSSFVVATRFQL